MGMTGAPVGRTEVLVPPSEPHERALAREKNPMGPGTKRVSEQWKKCFYLTFFEK